MIVFLVGFCTVKDLVGKIILEVFAARPCLALMRRASSRHFILVHKDRLFDWILNGSGLGCESPFVGVSKSFTLSIDAAWMSKAFHFGTSFLQLKIGCWSLYLYIVPAAKSSPRHLH